MTRYAEAVAALFLEGASTAGMEIVPLTQALGRVAGEDLFASEPNPPFDNSAMDGFAVNSADAAKLRGREIDVIGSLSAGDGPLVTVSARGAIEIMTGAPFPGGFFDAVVKIEDVVVTRDVSGMVRSIRLERDVLPGENVRRSGEDIRPGDLLIEAGTRLDARHLPALAALGFARVPVRKKPNITFVSTGSELAPADASTLAPGQIRNSTALLVGTELTAMGADVVDAGVIADDEAGFRKAVLAAFTDGDADVFVSTGAVSMGKRDFVEPVVRSLGGRVHFHKCAIRPGKPVLFATFEVGGRRRSFIGLPGNPVSTAVGLRFFVDPLVRRFLGRPAEVPRRALLKTGFAKPEGLRCFFKARVADDGATAWVEALPGQASFMVSPLLRANAWVVFDETGSRVERSTLVEVFSL